MTFDDMSDRERRKLRAAIEREEAGSFGFLKDEPPLSPMRILAAACLVIGLFSVGLAFQYFGPKRPPQEARGTPHLISNVAGCEVWRLTGYDFYLAKCPDASATVTHEVDAHHNATTVTP